jgi:hypothetical protein
LVALLAVAACTEPLARPSLSPPDAGTLADPPPERPEGGELRTAKGVAIPSPIQLPDDEERVRASLALLDGKARCIVEPKPDATTASLLAEQERLYPGHICAASMERAVRISCSNEVFLASRLRDKGETKDFEEAVRAVMRQFAPGHYCYKEAQKLLERDFKK